MSSENSDSQPRWWRRSRDLALHAARESRSSAAEAMFDLDTLQRDLPALMSAHADGLRLRQRAGQGPMSDPTLNDWSQVSTRTEAVMTEFLDLDSQFDREKDYEESEANRYRVAFDEISSRMRALTPQVQQFRNRHEDALLAAHNRTLAIPRALQEAEASLGEAKHSYAQMQTLGLTDSTVADSYGEAAARMEAAKQALARKEWTTAARDADAAKSLAHQVAARLSGLEKQAQEVHNGYLSVRTRRDALQTQADRLPPIMSELRRRYTAGSWQHLDDAPGRVSAAIATVNEGLTRLGAALKANPLDVPKAAALLRQVRAAASDVDSIIRSAVDTLRRLDEVSADPETLLVAVRRKTIDARRFLANLPSEKAQRFTYTFDNIAARTDRLVASTKKPHPDWGQVIEEAKSIEDALDAMIRTARSS